MTRPPATTSQDAQHDDAARAEIGLVAALPMELSEFLSRCTRVKSYSGPDFVFSGGLYDDIRIAAVQSGTGQSRARRATHALLDAHHPKWIISIGFAGSLTDEVAKGHIVVANDIVDESLRELKIDLAMPGDPAHGRHVGRLLTVDRIVRTVAEKRELHERTKALALDMETLAVAEVCRERSIRFMAIRAISDDLSADLPPEVLSLMGATGAIRMGAVIGSLFKRPSSMKDMLRLREDANVAAGRLANFLDGVIVQLHKAG